MESKTRRTLKPVTDIQSLTHIEHVEIIARELYHTRLDPKVLKQLEPHLRIISSYLGVSDFQSAIFSILVALNLQSSTVDMHEIARFFEVNIITVAKNILDFKTLIEKKLIRATTGENRRRRQQEHLNSEEYFVERNVYQSLLTGSKINNKANPAKDVYDFLHEVGTVLKGKNDYSCFDDLTNEIDSLISENGHLDFIKALKMFDLTPESIIIYLFVSIEFATDPNENIELSNIIGYLFDDIRKNMRIRKLFLSNEHPLLKYELLELEQGSFRSDRAVLLTDKSVEMITGEDRALFEKIKVKNQQEHIILSKNIVPVKLFFDQKMQKSIDFIYDILMPENHQTLMKRLMDEGLRGGLCIMFYGYSGCGKTELVKQIALKTGRDIIQINISETKSKWYGDSEKLIKKVFDNYRDRVEKTTSVSPVMLINEADGIFSIRKPVSESNVSSTEVAYQAILLNELESLSPKSIVFLCLNNIKSIDSSFYRRVLIKQYFGKNDPSVRAQMWKSKLPFLTEDELNTLAQFGVSGGAIENVQRKIILTKALYNVEKPDINMILDFIKEENVGKNETIPKIGFIK